MRAPSQRPALGALFLVLTIVFAGITYAAATSGVWVVAIAAAVLAAWLAQMAWRGLKRPRA